jgi:hypothetical protein
MRLANGSSPKISEGPQPKMPDWRRFFLFRQFAILPRSAWSPSATWRFGPTACRGRVANDLVAVHFLLVSPGTGCACPPIATRRFVGQGWLNTAHMEEVLAPVAFYSVLSVRGYQVKPEGREKRERVRLTGRTTSGTFRIDGYLPSNPGQFLSPPQCTRILPPESRIRSPGLRNHTVERLCQNARTPITYGS